MTEEQLASNGLAFVVESEIWRFSYMNINRPGSYHVDITPFPNKVIDGTSLKHIESFIHNAACGFPPDNSHLALSINEIFITGWSTYTDVHTPKFVYDGTRVLRNASVEFLACVFGLTVESTEKTEREDVASNNTQEDVHPTGSTGFNWGAFRDALTEVPLGELGPITIKNVSSSTSGKDLSIVYAEGNSEATMTLSPSSDSNSINIRTTRHIDASVPADNDVTETFVRCIEKSVYRL